MITLSEKRNTLCSIDFSCTLSANRKQMTSYDSYKDHFFRCINELFVCQFSHLLVSESLLELDFLETSFKTSTQLLSWRGRVWPTEGHKSRVSASDPYIQPFDPQYILNPGPHPSHGMDHSLKRLMIWVPVDSSWPLFHYLLLSHSVRKLSDLHKPQAVHAYIPSSCLHHFLNVANRRMSVEWWNEQVSLTEGTWNVAGQPTT